MPTGLVEGSAEIAGVQGEHQHILVTMDAGIYNVRKAVCQPVCIVCNGVTNTFIVDSPFAVALASTKQQTFYMHWNTGSQYDITGDSRWTSNATSVATVSSGLVSGVGEGSPTISAVDTIIEPVYNSCASSTSVCGQRSSGTTPRGSSGGKVQKPGFLQIVSTANSQACLTLSCEVDVQYRVLDANKGRMNIPGMQVVETVNKTGGSCGNTQLTNKGQWKTDATGTLIGTDVQLACPDTTNPALTCTLVYTQTFTVNGFPVFLLSADGLTAGGKNTITFQIKNDVSACPIATITP